MKTQIGLDEAGRGCVLGPMYVGAAVFSSNDDEKYFKDLGVRDSKKLTPVKRELYFEEIKKRCHILCKTISTDEIDSGNLNNLEFKTMVSLVKDIVVQHTAFFFKEVDFHLYIDCPEQDQNEHANLIKEKIPHSCLIKVTSEHKADDNFVVVGAASVVAKVLRDREIDRIKKIYHDEYGDIGSGYPGDSKTRRFLEKYFIKNSSFPIETRMKWGTVEKIRRNYEDSESIW